MREPTRCPACGSGVVRRPGEVALRCGLGTSCPGVVREAIEFFAARGAMNIDSLGPKLVEQLIDSGLVSDPADLFDLTVDKLVPLERMAEKSARNLVDALEAARKNATLARLLVALGIPHLGGVAARAVAERFRSLDALINAAADGERFREDLEDVEGIGPKIAAVASDFFADAQNRALLDKLRERGIRPVEPEREMAEGPLSGSTFCVTGTLSKSRDAIHADIAAAGGRVVSSVSKRTGYLVAGEKTGAAKLKAAAKHGVRVIDEAELYRLITGSPSAG